MNELSVLAHATLDELAFQVHRALRQSIVAEHFSIALLPNDYRPAYIPLFGTDDGSLGVFLNDVPRVVRVYFEGNCADVVGTGDVAVIAWLAEYFRLDAQQVDAVLALAPTGDLHDQVRQRAMDAAFGMQKYADLDGIFLGELEGFLDRCEQAAPMTSENYRAYVAATRSRE